MSLREKVLQEVTIKNYYADNIQNTDKRFRDGFNSKNMAICPLPKHDDTDPSFGLVPDKAHKGVFKYHCMGCGRVGDVIRLHQTQRNRDVSGHEKANFITYEEATLELAKKYNITYTVGEEIEKIRDINSIYAQRMMYIHSMMDTYTIGEFERDITNLKLKSQGMNEKQKALRLNKLIVKRLTTSE